MKKPLIIKMSENRVDKFELQKTENDSVVSCRVLPHLTPLKNGFLQKVTLLIPDFKLPHFMTGIYQPLLLNLILA
jgi:hypothetical protein